MKYLRKEKNPGPSRLRLRRANLMFHLSYMIYLKNRNKIMASKSLLASQNFRMISAGKFGI